MLRYPKKCNCQLSWFLAQGTKRTEYIAKTSEEGGKAEKSGLRHYENWTNKEIYRRIRYTDMIRAGSRSEQPS